MNDKTQSRTPKFKIFAVADADGEILGYYFAASKPSAMAMHTASLDVYEAGTKEIMEIGRDGITVQGMFDDSLGQGRLDIEPPTLADED